MEVRKSSPKLSPQSSESNLWAMGLPCYSVENPCNPSVAVQYAMQHIRDSKPVPMRLRHWRWRPARHACFWTCDVASSRIHTALFGDLIPTITESRQCAWQLLLCREANLAHEFSVARIATDRIKIGVNTDLQQSGFADVQTSEQGAHRSTRRGSNATACLRWFTASATLPATVR